MSRITTLADITASDAPIEISKKQFETYQTIVKEKIKQLQDNLIESDAQIKMHEAKASGANEFIKKMKSDNELMKKEMEILKGKQPKKMSMPTTESTNIDFDAIKKSGKELYEKKYKKEVDEYLRTLSL